MTTTQPARSARAIALADDQAREAERRRRDEDAAARRARDEQLADENALDDFLASPVAAEWFNGVTWELVTRRAAPRTVVVRSVEDAPVYLVVTREPVRGPLLVRVPHPNVIAQHEARVSSDVNWLVHAEQVRCAADVGAALRRFAQPTGRLSGDHEVSA